MNKRILALLLAVAVILGLTVSAQTPPITTLQAPSLGWSFQSTVKDGGNTITNLGDTITEGNSFEVVFDRTAFNLSPTGDGTYDPGKLNINWAILEGATLDRDFSFTEFRVNPENGTTTFVVKALRPFSGTIKIYLNSGTTPTKAIEKAVTVKELFADITQTNAYGTPPTSATTGSVKLLPGDTISYRIPANNFNWSNTGTKRANTLTDTSWIKLSGATIGTDFGVEYTTPENSQDVTVKITALKNGSYPNLALYMQGGNGQQTALSAPLNVTVQTPGTEITGIADGAKLGIDGGFLNGQAVTYNELKTLQVHVNDTITIPLNAGLFTWNENPPSYDSPVTTTQLRRAKISLITSNRKGVQVFESGTPRIVNKNGRAYIEIKIAQDVPSTRDIDFEMEIFLAQNRTRHRDSSLVIYGTLARELIYVDYDDGYFDISDGSVLETEGFVRNAEVYIGNGVTLFSNLYQNKRYAGYADNRITIADENVIREFPTIEDVVRVRTNGFIQGATKVSFDNYYPNMYVYNQNGDYLGHSSEKLPLENMYYFSSAKIDMRPKDTPQFEPEPGAPEPGDILEDPFPDYEGLPNINANPATGR